MRTNFTSVILQMASLGLGLIDDFPFIDPPDRRAIRDGYDALQELGAIDGEYRLTPLGKQLARLPADPRIARMIVAGHELNCLAPVLIVAAALSVQDPRDRPQDAKQKADEAHRKFAGENSDFSSFINLFRAYREQAESLSKGKLRAWCEAHFVSFTRMREWLDIHAQLEETSKELGFRPSGPQGDDAAVHRALLTGLLRNVAVKCEDGTYLGARNVKLNLFPGSVLAKKRPSSSWWPRSSRPIGSTAVSRPRFCPSGSSRSPNTWWGAATSSRIGNGPAGGFLPTCASRSSGLPSSPNARSTTPGSIPNQRAKSSSVPPWSKENSTPAARSSLITAPSSRR